MIVNLVYILSHDVVSHFWPTWPTIQLIGSQAPPLSKEGSLSRRVSIQESLCRGGLCPGVSTCRVSVQGGLPDRKSPVNGITDRCKNITLPQLRCER